MGTITDSVDPTKQSQSGYCLCDICFALYKMQMAVGASGAVIKLHIIAKEESVFTYLYCNVASVYLWINDGPRCCYSVLKCCKGKIIHSD